jgi:multiple sugar transport system substrate-binding protein
MRRAKISAFAALLAAIMSTGLAAENIKLTFMFWGSPAEQAAITKACKDFEAANPGISVEPLYAVYSGAEYDAKMKAMSESDTLPDCGYFASETIYSYAANDFFLDLAPYVKADNLEKDYLSQAWIRSGKKIIGAYTAAEAQVMYYNQDTLKKAGVPFPPTDYKKAWSWDDAVKAWTKLTVDVKGKHPGEAGFDPKHIACFGVNHEVWTGMLWPRLWANGGDIFSADGKDVLIDKPETIAAIQQLADLRNKYMVMSSPGLTEYNATGKTDPKVLLQNGQIAFYVSGAWELLDFAKMNFPLGVAAIPLGKRPAQVYISGVNVVFKKTKHPAEAWKLQKWMMDPAKTTELYSGGLWMPTKKSWYENKADLAKWLDNPAHPKGFKEAIVDSMAVARNEPLNIKNSNQIITEFINPELDKVWQGKDTAENAMKRAAAAVRKSGLLQGLWN